METAEAPAATGMELEKRTECRAARRGVGPSCSSLHGPEAPASHTHQELGNRRCHQEHQPLLDGPRQSAHSVGHAQPVQPSLPWSLALWVTG